MTSIQLKDSNGEIISIDTENYDYKVTWRGTPHTFKREYEPRLSVENCTFVKIFKIDEIEGIHIKVHNEDMYILDEKISKKVIKVDGWKHHITISGPPRYRKLTVQWPLTEYFNRTNSTHIDNDVTIDDIEYGEILSRSQDMPHGIQMIIKGQEEELTHYYEVPSVKEICLDYIQGLVNGDTEVDTLLTVIKNIEILDILKGKDVLTLAEEIHSLKSQLKDANETITKDGGTISRLDAEVVSLRSENNKIKEELTKLKQERSNFKQTLLNKVQEALTSIDK